MNKLLMLISLINSWAKHFLLYNTSVPKFLAPACPASPNITHSTKNTSVNYVNTAVEYLCDFGYQLESRSIGEYEQYIKCAISNYDGVPYWEGVSNLTVCIPINCESPPTLALTTALNVSYAQAEGYTSNSTLKPYFIDSKVFYECNSGFVFNHNNQLTAEITCQTVSGNSHVAAWGPLDIGCIRM